MSSMHDQPQQRPEQMIFIENVSTKTDLAQFREEEFCVAYDFADFTYTKCI